MGEQKHTSAERGRSEVVQWCSLLCHTTPTGVNEIYCNMPVFHSKSHSSITQELLQCERNVRKWDSSAHRITRKTSAIFAMSECTLREHNLLATKPSQRLWIALAAAFGSLSCGCMHGRLKPVSTKMFFGVP